MSIINEGGLFHKIHEAGKCSLDGAALTLRPNGRGIFPAPYVSCLHANHGGLANAREPLPPPVSFRDAETHRLPAREAGLLVVGAGCVGGVGQGYAEHIATVRTTRLTLPSSIQISGIKVFTAGFKV